MSFSSFASSVSPAAMRESQNESKFTIVFDENITRVIATSYKDLKPISKEEFLNRKLNEVKKEEVAENAFYMYHDVFGYGKVLNEDGDNYTIRFKNGSTKIIAKSFTGLTSVSKEKYDSNLKKTITDETQNKEKSLKVDRTKVINCLRGRTV